MNCVLAFDVEGFQPDQADMVVSLSPEASFFFDGQGIPYRLMNDFYLEADLFGQEKSKVYFKLQMEFMTEMDAFFQEYSGLCREFNIPLCSVNYLKVKYAMDYINMSGWILERFFDANTGIKSVTLLLGKESKGEESPSFFLFTASQKAVYAKVVERICGTRGISFAAVRIASNAQAMPAVSPSPLQRIRRASKDWLKIPYRYLSYHKSSCPPAASTESLLFLHHGAYEIDHFIRQALSRGIRVFVREGSRVILENSAFRTEYTMGPEKDSRKIRDDLRLCADDIRKNEGTWFLRLRDASLWEGAANVLRPLLARYAENEACQMLSGAQAWKPYIMENRIDAVLGRANTDLDSLAVLIAARQLCSKKTVCIQHAPSALEGEAMNVYDGITYDYILARDPVTYAYFKSWGRTESQLGWSGHYLNRLRKTSQKGWHRKSEKIAYVPKNFHENVRCFNEYSYPFVWYYEWQKRIMGTFAKLKPRSFVYKHTPLQDWVSRLIVPYIQTLGADNIEVVEAPFSKVLNQFDRIITDYPSGAFFEALACRKSVLCIHPEYFRINPEAMRLFGQCFASFETIEESLAIIEKFIRSDANIYRAELPLEEINITQLVSNVIAAPVGQAGATAIR